MSACVSDFVSGMLTTVFTLRLRLIYEERKREREERRQSVLSDTSKLVHEYTLDLCKCVSLTGCQSAPTNLRYSVTTVTVFIDHSLCRFFLCNFVYAFSISWPGSRMDTEIERWVFSGLLSLRPERSTGLRPLFFFSSCRCVRLSFSLGWFLCVINAGYPLLWNVYTYHYGRRERG